MNLKLSKLIFAIGITTILSCTSESEPIPEITIEKSSVLDNYATIVFANYSDAKTDAESLQTAINVFVTTPTEANFTAAKDAWLNARESYGQTEAFRFASGPIDDTDGPEGLLNAWPLDENYVDYVVGEANSGIINNLVDYPTIDKATLESLNEVGSETNISVGYHAIEFLLWGQDTTVPSEKLAGQRPYTDFVDGGTADNQDRRRDYLAACADLLIDHLQLMITEWQVGGAYRTTFLALDEDTAIKNILTALATLSKSELGGERIFVAYDNQDQEDEHSCFSDNTHRDIRLNLAGIANVYRGSYGSISGDSLEDLISETNPTLAAEITAQLVAAENAIDATATPFDFAISDTSERPFVLASVNALQDLGDKFVEGGSALGISISSQLPD
ncbi:putative iron-regulated protein [Polaribacter sp. KT25b]|uniref:imelysin family protein n=1 Tax=Polaribacter sp. KT25b TaxID=1855336 RepID=UPI0008792549|nr:imelysin family protein [Polaribacter sp. KT25b]SDS06272.1 putative iron-regulated protein [Polaribacter sp. KT25b]